MKKNFLGIALVGVILGIEGVGLSNSAFADNSIT